MKQRTISENKWNQKTNKEEQGDDGEKKNMQNQVFKEETSQLKQVGEAGRKGNWESVSGNK